MPAGRPDGAWRCSARFPAGSLQRRSNPAGHVGGQRLSLAGGRLGVRCAAMSTEGVVAASDDEWPEDSSSARDCSRCGGPEPVRRGPADPRAESHVRNALLLLSSAVAAARSDRNAAPYRSRPIGPPPDRHGVLPEFARGNRPGGRILQIALLGVFVVVMQRTDRLSQLASETEGLGDEDHAGSARKLLVKNECFAERAAHMSQALHARVFSGKAVFA